MPRKTITKKARFEIFKRDGFVCQYCGAQPPSVILHIDHITPVKLGGGNDIENLVTSCQRCNQGKSSTPLNQIPKSLKDRASEIEEMEAQIKGYADIMQSARDRIDDEMWIIGRVLFSDIKTSGMYKSDAQSIKMFIKRLGYHEVLDAAEKADAKKPHQSQTNSRFKYFCGICWKKIKDAQAQQ